MALTQVTGPYPIFTDLDGSPLDDGYLYIGAANQDPETNPIQVFWDSALTIPATQPIRTNNGYAWRNGTPGLLYTGGEFSITIRNKRNEFVLYSPLGYGFDPKAVSASVVKNDFTGDGVETDFTLSASPSTKLATNIFINGVYQEKDSYNLSGNVISFSIAPPLSSSIEILTNETGVINSGNANDVSYTAGFAGATLQSVQSKLEQYISVKDFGAVCDGVTDDWAAIQAAQEYLKANGGGTLYFPGWCAIYNTFYFYGAVTGQWSNPYPIPTPPRITWESDGAGGIKSFIASGDVLRFSSPSSTLTYAPCFKDFAIDCTANDVTAINGTAQAGVYGPNHFTDIDGLIIQGLSGANAVGVALGTITDSTIRNLVCQAYGAQARSGVIINKANVQLFGCRFSYFNYGIEVGELAEAGIYMFGGHILSSKLYSIYWNNAGPDFKSSGSTLSGVFIGEQTAGGRVLGAANPANLDIGTITFQGCVFDNYRIGENLIDITWGGKFNFIGCNNWGLSPGLNKINFGQYCYVNMLNNQNITVDATSAALYNGQINELPFATNIAFAPAFSASGSTFNYAVNGQSGFYSKVGNQVTVTIRLFLDTSGNTLTGSPLKITNLPFPVSSKIYARSSFNVMWFGAVNPFINMYGIAPEGSTEIELYALAAADITAGSTTLKANDLNGGAGAGLAFNFSYFTDA